MLRGRVEQDEDFERRLVEQREWLAYVRAGGTEPPPAQPELEDSIGTAGDGAVRVAMRDRRITSVVIGTGVSGQPPGAVSELLAEAVNAALAQALIDAPAAGDPGPDLNALSQQLGEFASQGEQAMRGIQAALEASMAKLAAKTGIRGDASPQYVDYLFQDAMDVVNSARISLSADPVPVSTGEGRDETEEVFATVTNGRLTAIEVTPFAVQLSPAELGQAVLEAVNEALDEWEQEAAAAPRAALDVEALRKISDRAEKVGEQGMQHLRAYTTSMTSIMRNID
ncbi:YbaB/EbfC family nucleoid-associated protein [Umezawaea sp. Da 62-37]|uniref:YbaB/EbfC family nucleoid-associated protein n=1 Tax=Umezawaea sp. Da 62-37 TaxID=3075927 RepID=UPI0028F74F93|nr:YbaB/EbfC family nucleoid-associated protein [Umezawaea sp. Da 62-37]WNV87848.1 YbaB/EbfC family nucleoid-associated protein [Umezawaea sp. Da 62-37]